VARRSIAIAAIPIAAPPTTIRAAGGFAGMPVRNVPFYMPGSILAISVRCRRCFILLSALAATVSSAGCGSKPSSPATAVSPDTWAVVDGREIKRADVEKAYQRTEHASRTLSDMETLAAKLTLLDDLITQDIILAKARDLKIDVPAAELDAAYAAARKNVPDAQFQQELTRRGLTAADMREGLRRDILARKLIEREVGAKVTVTDQEIADFFNANRAQFNLAEDSYRIAQIVVTPVREAQRANRTGNDATTPQAAAAKIQTLMERLKGGASFEELAMDYSEDPESASRGGDLGFVPVSRLQQVPSQLRNAVLNKPAGTVSVVSSGGGHTIVLVVAHESAGQRDLSMPAVRERITQTLRSGREQLLRAAYLMAARSDAEVVNYLARGLVQSQGKMPRLAPVAPGR
jgi:peptidyl-prolyl cis-trans isomerase SurA